MNIAAIVDLIVGFLKQLLANMKLKKLQTAADQAKEKSNETLAKERSDFDSFEREFADFKRGENVPRSTEPLPRPTSGAAADNRPISLAERKARRVDKGTKQAVKRREGRGFNRK